MIVRRVQSWTVMIAVCLEELELCKEAAIHVDFHRTRCNTHLSCRFGHCISFAIHDDNQSGDHATTKPANASP